MTVVRATVGLLVLTAVFTGMEPRGLRRFLLTLAHTDPTVFTPDGAPCTVG